MIMKNDPSCDTEELMQITESAMESLLGVRCGPYRCCLTRQCSSQRRKAGAVQEFFGHTLCLLWSPEVYVNPRGEFQEVENAYRRSRRLVCSLCGARGATLGCKVRRCGRSFHIPCAMLSSEATCILDESDYTLTCAKHHQEGL